MPKLKYIFLIAAATSFGSHLAQAQYSDEYNKCSARAHGNTVQEGLCAQKELSLQDDRLNKSYQALLAQYSATPEKKVHLREEERAWLKKRDYDCKLNRDTIDNGCLLQKTADRANDLEQKLKF